MEMARAGAEASPPAEAEAPPLLPPPPPLPPPPAKEEASPPADAEAPPLAEAEAEASAEAATDEAGITAELEDGSSSVYGQLSSRLIRFSSRLFVQPHEVSNLAVPELPGSREEGNSPSVNEAEPAVETAKPNSFNSAMQREPVTESSDGEALLA